MDYKNIVIVGYPKSGTTWISGLVSALIQCPLKGHWWHEEIDSLFTIDLHNDSKYRCYKSHHLGDEIFNISSKPIHKVIYVIRDPRDIVISGMHYFDFIPTGLHFIRNVDMGFLTVLIKKALNRLLPSDAKKKQMINAVLKGNYRVNEWLTYSWEDHINSYRHKDIFFIKYEQLLEKPQETCIQLLKYLEINTDQAHIDQSILEHSFARRKKKLQEENSPIINLLRKGVIGSWKKHFTSKEIYFFKMHFKNKDLFYRF